MFRFAGSFLLRFETRTFSGLLFQAPPRIAAVLRSYQCKPGIEQLPPQARVLNRIGGSIEIWPFRGPKTASLWSRLRNELLIPENF